MAGPKIHTQKPSNRSTKKYLLQISFHSTVQILKNGWLTTFYSFLESNSYQVRIWKLQQGGLSKKVSLNFQITIFHLMNWINGSVSFGRRPRMLYAFMEYFSNGYICQVIHL